MRRRQTSEDERAEFEAAFKETRPIKKAAKPSSKAAPKAAGPKAKGKPSGVDGNTGERLRKGEMTPDARIDLHGFTESVAYRTLLNFLRGAQRNGARLALVITGKGKRRADPHEPFDMEGGACPRRAERDGAALAERAVVCGADRRFPHRPSPPRRRGRAVRVFAEEDMIHPPTRGGEENQISPAPAASSRSGISGRAP